MAKISGPGIDPKGSYTAIPAWGRGLYLLAPKDAPEAVSDGLMTIKITQEAARRIGRHKLPGETLSKTIERLALASLLSQKQAAG